MSKFSKKILVFVHQLKNSHDFFEFDHHWIFARIIILIVVNGTGEDEFSFLAVTTHPMVNIPQSLLKLRERI